MPHLRSSAPVWTFPAATEADQSKLPVRYGRRLVRQTAGYSSYALLVTISLICSSVISRWYSSR